MKPTLATSLILGATLAAESAAHATPTVTELFGFPCSYTTGCPDGSAPNSLIQASDGEFYGATATTIFKITAGGKFTLLFTAPYGNFYGTSSFAAGMGAGIFGGVFRMSPAGQLAMI